MLLCKHPDAQLSRVQPQPLHGQIAYKRCIGHVHVEPGERSLVHTHVRRGVRPNGGRNSLLFARSLIRHSNVHGFTEVRRPPQSAAFVSRAPVKAERSGFGFGP